METGTETGVVKRDDGKENREEGRSRKRAWEPATHQDRSRVKHQTLSSRTRHYLCRQEMAFAGRQQLLGEDPTPAGRRCTDGKTALKRRKGGNIYGNRDGGEHRDRGGNGNRGSGGPENGEKGGREIKSGNLRSSSRGGMEDAREGGEPPCNGSHSRKTRGPRETIVPCGIPKPGDGKGEAPETPEEL